MPLEARSSAVEPVGPARGRSGDDKEEDENEDLSQPISIFPDERKEGAPRTTSGTEAPSATLRSLSTPSPAKTSSGRDSRPSAARAQYLYDSDEDENIEQIDLQQHISGKSSLTNKRKSSMPDWLADDDESSTVKVARRPDGRARQRFSPRKPKTCEGDGHEASQNLFDLFGESNAEDSPSEEATSSCALLQDQPSRFATSFSPENSFKFETSGRSQGY